MARKLFAAALFAVACSVTLYAASAASAVDEPEAPAAQTVGAGDDQNIGDGDQFTSLEQGGKGKGGKKKGKKGGKGKKKGGKGKGKGKGKGGFGGKGKKPGEE